MPTLADQAEQHQREVCNAAAQGRAAADAMSKADTARDYMALALIATKARDAAAALDAIGLKDQELAVALQQAQQLQNRCRLQQQDAAAAEQGSEASRTHLDLNFDHDSQADLNQGALLLQYAKTAAGHSHASTEEVRGLLRDSPPQAASIATAALEAAEAAQRFAARACAMAARLSTAALAAPSSAAGCTDDAAYNQHLATLHAAANRLPASSVGVMAAEQTLQQSVTAANANVNLCRQNFQPQHVEDARIAALAINNANEMARTRNGFGKDILSANRLLGSASRLAAGNMPIVDQTLGAAPQGGAPVPGGLTALASNTADLAGGLVLLRAALVDIEQSATEASRLVPYDPAQNSTNAETALDQKDAANSGIEDLARLQIEAASAVKNAQTELQTAKTLLAKPSKTDRTLQNATDKVLSRQHAVQTAIANAKAAWGGLGAIYARCADTADVATARAAFAQAQAQLDNAKAAPRQRVDRADAGLKLAQSDELRVKQALDEAKKCAKAADDAAAQAVTLRIRQLEQEGHGPQRHEGAPTPATLGERALYLIDPETHTQRDVETGELHAADLNASKIKTEEAYVRAEALARRERAKLGNLDGDPPVTVRLATIGTDIAMGVTCDARPASSPTSLGMATTLPVVATYAYDAGTAPPTRAQMNVQAMQEAVAAQTSPTVFAADAEAFAVLRTDVNGKVYLRTMWPQNRA